MPTCLEGCRAPDVHLLQSLLHQLAHPACLHALTLLLSCQPATHALSWVPCLTATEVLLPASSLNWATGCVSQNA